MKIQIGMSGMYDISVSDMPSTDRAATTLRSANGPMSATALSDAHTIGSRRQSELRRASKDSAPRHHVSSVAEDNDALKHS